MRFHVHKKGNVIKLNGSLNDDVNFGALDEMINDAIAIDCKALTHASWIGLVDFNKYLLKKGGNIVLENVPLPVLRYFRLFPDFGKSYSVVSYEIPAFDTKNAEASITPITVQTDDIAKTIMTSTVGDVLLNDGSAVEGLMTHWIPSVMPIERAAKISYLNGWCEENTDEYAFWQKFVCFSSSTVGLAGDLLVSTEQGLTKTLAAIRHRVQTIECGMKVLLPDRKQNDIQTINDIIQWTETQCGTLSEEITEIQNRCNTITRRLQALSFATTGDTQGELYGNICNFSHAIIALTKIAGEMENAGAELGQKVIQLSLVTPLKEALQKIEESKVTSEILAQARDSFTIMDPLSEGSWPDTREEIFHEIDAVDTDLGKCITLLQGFDLVRQVLEHRIDEGKYLDRAVVLIKGGDELWLNTREELFAKATRMMVTDQEKFSFAFFFPVEYEAHNQTPSKSPGEVLLF